MKNYFDILGVGKEASEEDIKKAYRSLAMKHHPDRGGDQGKFQDIEEAYRVLSDPNQRMQWEQQSRNPFHGHQPGGFHFNFGGGPDINEIFRQFHPGGDPFAGFQQQQRRRNRDLKVVLELDLESTLSQQSKVISLQHVDGSRHEITVDIPRGVRQGMQMKYGGHGDHSNRDTQPGDLYIEFRIKPHPEFQVDGIDLVKTVELDCFDAMTGMEYIITGLDGRQFSWNIPPGTQANDKFRITGQGIWAVDHPVRGNIIAVVNVVIPKLSRDQIQAVKDLKDSFNTNK